MPVGSEVAPLPVVRERWLFLLSMLGSLGLAVPKVCRELAMMGESAELVAAAAVWGVPRAPGYPLWTGLGHLASLLPFGSLAFRVNLTSALHHAIAVGAVACIAQHLSRSVAGGVAAALVLALSKSFLLGSLYAEVFPLNDALFALGLWLALRAGEDGSRRDLVLAAVTLGLALAHHELALLGLPAIALMLGRRPERPGELALAASGAFVGSQLLLLLAAGRDPALLAGDASLPGGLWRMLARSEWGGLFGFARQATIEPAEDRIGAFALLLLESFGPLALGFAVVGIFALLRERRLHACVAMLLAVALPGPALAALFRLGVEGESALASFERFTTMSHVGVAILAGVGVISVLRGFARAALPLPRREIVALAVALVPVLPRVPKLGEVDLARERWGGALARDFLRGLPDGALVLVTGDFYAGVSHYACAVQRQCTRVKVVMPGLLSQPWRRARHERQHPELPLPEGRMLLARTHELVAQELPRRAVFAVPALAAKDPELERRFQLVPERLLVRILPDPPSAARAESEGAPVRAAILSGRECEGCALDPRAALRPSQHVQVLIAYSVMMENAARMSFRLGEIPVSEQLGARFHLFDAAVGVQLSVPPGGYNP